MSTVLQIDETAGIQYVQGSLITNDVSLASLPSDFSTVLAAITAAGTGTGQTAIGAAVSGAAAATPTGANALTFGPNVTDVGFVLTGGDGADSLLTTTGGRKIFLYVSSTDNNIVLAREGTSSGLADPNGKLAFAVYLDTGTAAAGDAGATGAKVWVAQYEALHHPLGGDANPNDIVYLSGVLNYQVNTLQSFSLANAPSGQNLFLMFGHAADAATPGDDVALVVTAADAAAGGTVNTSQGGTDATIGTNNQMIDANHGLIFTFVTNSNPNYTVPNLTHAEATTAADIQFGGLAAAAMASFVVSQTQPNGQTCTVKMSAFNTALETGAAYIPGLSGDARVAIQTVTVKNAAGTVLETYGISGPGAVNSPNLSISVDANGVATVVGVKADYHVEYTTSGMHNRVEIDNAGTGAANNAKFDVGNFQLATGSNNASPLADIGFVDDAPVASAVLGAGGVTHDETAGNDADANDTSLPAVAALFSGVTPTSTQMAAGYAKGTAAVIDSSASAGGVDGLASSAYSLNVSAAGVDSGLDTTAGASILLFKEGSLVVGRISGGADNGKAAFAIAIDASTGVLSMAQYNAIKHPTGGAASPDEALSIAGNALFATVTVTDGDGDTNPASVDIGARVAIQDDAPVASAVLGAGGVTHDETAGIDADANDTSLPAVAALFSGVTTTSTQMAAGYAKGTAAVIDSSASTGGVDGLASSAYSLNVSAAGVDSGLDTTAGASILLYKEGSLVVGRISGGADNGKAAFAIAIDASTGVLSMAQYNAIKHPTGGAASPDEALSIASNALMATVTVTDGDGDTNAASVDIGARVAIQDDAPSLAFGNVIGTGVVDPQFGYWTSASGVDKLGAAGLDIALNGFSLVRPDGTTVAGAGATFGELAGSPDGSGNYLFSGTLTGDFDNNAATANTVEHFTLTAYANGRYAIDLVEGFMSTVTESTRNGTLDAGGPDPVRTLTIGSDNVVFFAAKPLATPAELFQGVGSDASGPTDPTEAQLQTNPLPSYIDGTKALNVSSSGIGNKNNNLQGDGTAAISSGDESFVANPGTQFTSAKVFVDNAVTGYDYTGGERLYYRLFFADGTESGQILVDHNVAANHVAASFTVDGGGKLIDAIQLTMASGVVKIPEIQFITQINNLANGIKLDFTSTVTDGDGDTASSAFTTNLSANKLGTFDYILNGVASKADAFNIDLAPAESKYQVNGFELGTDKLVLLGANSYTLDTSTADTKIDILEAGGQHTFVTVVGVHIAAGDIATLV